MPSSTWRSYVVAGLRDADPGSRVMAMERIFTGYVAIDDEVEALLLDALDDTGVYTFRERDWDDADDALGQRFCTRMVPVAEEAAKVLGSPKRRARSVAAIAARIEQRGPEASASLHRALGALAPESTALLLRAIEHPSQPVRAVARGALVRATPWSTPEQKLTIIARAIGGLAEPTEADDWLAFLENAHGYFAPHGPPAMREHLSTGGPSEETVDRWLASDVRSVRAVAICIVAHRAQRERARAIVAARIARALPGQRDAEMERDRMGHRRQTEIELAVHILAVHLPDALASIRQDDTAARDALHEYALHELRRIDSPKADVWFVAHELAKRVADDDEEVAGALAQRSSRRA